MTRRLPISEDEPGLRFAKTIIARLLAGISPQPRAGSWDEGWRLALEAMAYRIDDDLHSLTICKKRL
jgi:hypothetical protein